LSYESFAAKESANWGRPYKFRYKNKIRRRGMWAAGKVTLHKHKKPAMTDTKLSILKEGPSIYSKPTEDGYRDGKKKNEET